VVYLPKVGFGDLSQNLSHYEPMVVRFSGHRDPAGQLMFVDRRRRAGPAQVAAVGNIFRILKDELRVGSAADHDENFSPSSTIARRTCRASPAERLVAPLPICSARPAWCRSCLAPRGCGVHDDRPTPSGAMHPSPSPA
jgi:hypothetical protein